MWLANDTPASGPMLPLRPAQEVLEGDPFVGTVGTLMSPWQQCRVHEGRVRLSRISTGPATSYHPPTSVTRHGCSGPSSTDRGAASRGGFGVPVTPVDPTPEPSDLIEAFSPLPDRCFRMVQSRQLQATHCRREPAWKRLEGPLGANLVRRTPP